MRIRTRLTIGIAGVLLVSLVVLGAIIVAIVQTTLVDQVDARLRSTTIRAAPRGVVLAAGRGDRGGPLVHLRGDRQGPPPGDDADPFARPIARFVFAPDGTLHAAEPSGFADAPDPLPRLPALTGSDIDRLAGRIVTLPAVDGSLDYRVLIERSPGGLVVATAAPLDGVQAALSRIVGAIVVAGAIALVVAALAGWWLIRRGLRPVDQMVATAAAIAAGDLTRRVPEADPGSELGRLGAALNEMLTRIEQAIRAREASEERLRRFVADAAHELRTPLTSLRGYAELYRQGALATPETVAGAMGRIEAEGGRMARLVDDLLLLARLDRQRGLEREPVDLVAIAREAVADFAAVEPERPVDHDLAGEAVVLGDPIRLRQILDNLLANARTHTPAGTPVQVAVRQNGAAVELVVADQGPGIPRESQAKVFERFWRADPGRVRSRGGSGLDLAIVASLVQAHGGTVALASEPGHGAAFTVRLPLA